MKEVSSLSDLRATDYFGVVGLVNCANQAGSARIGSDVLLAVGIGLIFRLW